MNTLFGEMKVGNQQYNAPCYATFLLTPKLEKYKSNKWHYERVLFIHTGDLSMVSIDLIPEVQNSQLSVTSHLKTCM